jgi:hypothetical protein
MFYQFADARESRRYLAASCSRYDSISGPEKSAEFLLAKTLSDPSRSLKKRTTERVGEIRCAHEGAEELVIQRAVLSRDPLES